MRLNQSSTGRAPVSKRPEVRGSAMVETSLVLIVFLMLLIGIADVGQMLFLHVSLVERMREGLRYGVITYDPTAIQNIVLYGTASPADGATPSFNLTASMVNVSRMDAKAPEDRIVITLSNYPIQWFTPYIATKTTGKPIVEAQAMELGNLP
jgi:TadE-like protein